MYVGVGELTSSSVGVNTRMSSPTDPLTAVTILLVSFTLSQDFTDDKPFEVADRYDETDN